jgi:hypothetical protein
MADKLPLKIENGELKQFAATDTIPLANLPAGLGGGSSYTATVGDGSNTTITVTHSLNTTDVIVTVREVSSGFIVYPDVDVTGVNAINLIFVNAPTTNQYTVLVAGF